MTMLLFDLDSFITLFLIKKVKGFRDSYSLTRVLAWRFDIINVSDVTKELEDKKLIKTILEKGVEKYEITDQGLKYIDTNRIEGKALLLKRYEGEGDFIDSLFI